MNSGEKNEASTPIDAIWWGIVAHYHGERTHQGLGNELIVAKGAIGKTEGEICCGDRSDGLLRYYHRVE